MPKRKRSYSSSNARPLKRARWRSTPITARTAPTLAALVRRQALKAAHSENKYIDGELFREIDGGQTHGTSPFHYLADASTSNNRFLFYGVQGTGSSERLGREIYQKYVNARISVEVTPENTIGSKITAVESDYLPSDYHVDIALCCMHNMKDLTDTPVANADALATSVFQTFSGTAMICGPALRNLDHVQNFTVIKKWKKTIIPKIDYGTPNSHIDQPIQCNFDLSAKIPAKCSKALFSRTATTSTFSAYEANGLFFCVRVCAARPLQAASVPVSACDVEVHGRYRLTFSE